MDTENNRQKINWSYIYQTQCFFESDPNFTYIELPYFVPIYISNMTFQKLQDDKFILNDKKSILVGSAEQSFIHEMIRGKLTENRSYFSITPCFRDENEDKTHQKHFMKLELFSFHDNPNKATEQFNLFMKRAFYNFGNLIKSKNKNHAEIKKIDTYQYDIFLNDIEIGSYGIREIKLKNRSAFIAYGTGIAEPRYSYALMHNKN